MVIVSVCIEAKTPPINLVFNAILSLPPPPLSRPSSFLLLLLLLLRLPSTSLVPPLRRPSPSPPFLTSLHFSLFICFSFLSSSFSLFFPFPYSLFPPPPPTNLLLLLLFFSISFHPSFLLISVHSSFPIIIF